MYIDMLQDAPYFLKVNEDGDYISLCYDQRKSDFSLPLVRQSRGIIYHKDNLDYPVCHAMDKFFNYGEQYAAEIDWASAKVYEKIDGSLIKVWYHRGKWHISTNKMVDAFKAEYTHGRSFGQLVLYTLHEMGTTLDDFYRTLMPTYTYFFELATPENRVVVEHEDYKLYYLGQRHNATGQEVNMRDLYSQYFPVPKEYEIKGLENLIEAAATFDSQNEGFVVVDKDFNRIKVKSPAYVLAHHTMTGLVSKKSLVTIILEGEESEFLAYNPRYQDTIFDMKTIMREIQAYFKEALRWVDSKHYEKDFHNRKEYAALVEGYIKDKPKFLKRFLYMNYDDCVLSTEWLQDRTPDEWLRMIESLEY